MHKLILALCLTLSACAKTLEHPNQTGRLHNANINEASGLARSNIDSSRLWTINDGGADPVLYAIGLDGSDLGTFLVSGADNNDWEDLSSFVLGGQPMLLIADIGDNLGRRESVILYVLHEPGVIEGGSDEPRSLAVAWQIEFAFPNGPVDAESVSVDIENEMVLILSKREIPAVLYQVPLRRGAGSPNTIVTATKVGPVTSLPQPSQLDRDRALARLDWHWQPTAMDISAAADSAAILTYRGLYFYQRAENQSWYDAIQSEPRSVEFGAFDNAESVAFSIDGSAVFVTTEQTNAPLLRFDVISTTAITIMTLNVDNLFDNVDAPGKNDLTFLPLAEKQNDAHRAKCGEIQVESWRNQCLEWDWNDDILDRKLNAIAGAILAANDGRGPDIIALQEIENLAILERLRTDYLGDAGYLPAILIEGHDIRGIDVAFLTRLPMEGEPKLHPFPEDGIEKIRYDDTRGILEATFRMPDNSLLTGFAVHFPAPFHPTAMRVTAYEQLNALRKALPPERMAFAAGDFNTTSREDRELNMLQRLARPLWIVANDQGCEDCEGNYYYERDGTWSYLDLILWSPAENSGEITTWTIRAGSFAIANRGPGQSTHEHRPAHFESPGGHGVSDHWPVIVTLELK